jgi:GDPmannose 4,6-dehydratase
VPIALVTGIAGQDGHYLSEFLTAKSYEVVGISRRAHRLAQKPSLHLRNVDVTNRSALEQLFKEFDFDEVYNLAGPSFGPDSWIDPAATVQTLGTAVVHLLELVRHSGRARLFQASSSELFGFASESPQKETTPFRPITPYGFAKQLAHSMLGIWRERYGVFASCGILFNHESPLRRREFVTRKVTHEVARIKGGVSTKLRVGNLEARRDWSFAGDFAEGMWLMLQAEQPDDFVLASGVSHSVRDLCEIAFQHAGLDYRDYIEEQPDLVRAIDFDRTGDPSKISRVLGWRARTSFRDLVGMMVEADIRRIAEDTEC